jgi:hypothetical protein
MIQIIKNILPDEVNKNIILFLLKCDRWKIARDTGDEIKQANNLLFNKKGEDFGFSLQTYDILQNVYVDSPLNIYADIVYNIIKNHTKYKFIKPCRYYWNYYNKSSVTDEHTDMDHNWYVSFVYNLHDNDGGTEIDGTFYKSNSGEAILFPSNLRHKGIPAKTSSRFNLNCIIELRPDDMFK